MIRKMVMSINFSVTSKPATPIKNYYTNSAKNQPCNFCAETTKATEEKKSSNTLMYVGAVLAFLALVAGLIGLCRKGKTRDVEKPLNEGKAVAQKVEQNVGADDAAKGVNNADLGPIITSISPCFALSHWSYFSPGDKVEFITLTRSPKRL